MTQLVAFKRFKIHVGKKNPKIRKSDQKLGASLSCRLCTHNEIALSPKPPEKVRKCGFEPFGRPRLACFGCRQLGFTYLHEGKLLVHLINVFQLRKVGGGHSLLDFVRLSRKFFAKRSEKNESPYSNGLCYTFIRPAQPQ